MWYHYSYYFFNVLKYNLIFFINQQLYCMDINKECFELRWVSFVILEELRNNLDVTSHKRWIIPLILRTIFGSRKLAHLKKKKCNLIAFKIIFFCTIFFKSSLMLSILHFILLTFSYLLKDYNIAILKGLNARYFFFFSGKNSWWLFKSHWLLEKQLKKFQNTFNICCPKNLEKANLLHFIFHQ